MQILRKQLSVDGAELLHPCPSSHEEARQFLWFTDKCIHGDEDD